MERIVKTFKLSEVTEANALTCCCMLCYIILFKGSKYVVSYTCP